MALEPKVFRRKRTALGSHRVHFARILVEDVIEPVFVFCEKARRIVDHIGSVRAPDQVLGSLEVVLQDVVDHAGRQHAVGGGLDAIELVGKTGRPIKDEADVNDLRTVLAGLYQMLGKSHLILDGVAAPDIDEVSIVQHARVYENVRCGRADAVELGVEGAVVKTDGLHGTRAAKRVPEALGHECLEAVRRRNARAQVPQRDGFRAVRVTNLQHLVGNLVERLFPRNLFPLALATLADALERLLQTRGVIRLTPREASLLADMCILCLRPLIVGLLHTDDLAIFDNGFECTVVMVAPPRTCCVDERLAFFQHACSLLQLTLQVRWFSANPPLYEKKCNNALLQEVATNRYRRYKECLQQKVADRRDEPLDLLTCAGCVALPRISRTLQQMRGTATLFAHLN